MYIIDCVYLWEFIKKRVADSCVGTFFFMYFKHLQKIQTRFYIDYIINETVQGQSRIESVYTKFRNLENFSIHLKSSLKNQLDDFIEIFTPQSRH